MAKRSRTLRLPPNFQIAKHRESEEDEITQKLRHQGLQLEGF